MTPSDKICIECINKAILKEATEEVYTPFPPSLMGLINYYLRPYFLEG